MLGFLFSSTKAGLTEHCTHGLEMQQPCIALQSPFFPPAEKKNETKNRKLLFHYRTKTARPLYTHARNMYIYI